LFHQVAALVDLLQEFHIGLGDLLEDLQYHHVLFVRVPVLEGIISRSQSTDTQTKKGRVERWLNMEGKFMLEKPENISGKHILLVDDVVTTGATLEACGTELLKAQDVQLSIATVCYAARS